MATHSVIEINHDLAHNFRDDPEFGLHLYNALGKLYTAEQCRKILLKYGITLLDQHHSSHKRNG